VCVCVCVCVRVHVYVCMYIKGVHKVSLQFEKFITKAVYEISKPDWFYYNKYLLKFFNSI